MAADPLVARGRPYPGQKYKHGWIPVGGAPFDDRVGKALRGEAIADIPASLPRNTTFFTEDEIDGLAEYENFGQDLNEFLRAGGRAKVLPRQGAFETAVRQIDAAMEHSPAPEDLETWRGIYNLADVFGDGDLSGHEWTELGYSSSAIDRSSAEHYARFNGEPGDQAVARLLIPKGTPAAVLSEPPPKGAGEVVTGRGLRYRIVADHGVGEDGLRHLDIEVVPPIAARSVARALVARAWLRVEATRLGITRAGVVDAHGNVHSPTDGRFVEKALGADPLGLAAKAAHLLAPDDLFEEFAQVQQAALDDELAAFDADTAAELADLRARREAHTVRFDREQVEALRDWLREFSSRPDA